MPRHVYIQHWECGFMFDTPVIRGYVMAEGVVKMTIPWEKRIARSAAEGNVFWRFGEALPGARDMFLCRARDRHLKGGDAIAAPGGAKRRVEPDPR